MIDDYEWARAKELVWWGLALMGCLVVLILSACQTAEAVSLLPEGYGTATWSLVEAMMADLLSLLRLFLPL